MTYKSQKDADNTLLNATVRLFGTADGKIFRKEIEDLREKWLSQAMSASSEFEAVKFTQKAAGVNEIIRGIDACLRVQAARDEAARKEAEEKKKLDR